MLAWSSAYLGEKVVKEKEYLSAIETSGYLHKLQKESIE
jgi:hypothetical protein